MTAPNADTSNRPQQAPPAHLGNILVAAACGFAAAMLLMLSLRGQENPLWLVLAYLSPIPVFAAGLSQGRAAAVWATVVASGLLLLMLGTMNAVVFSVVFIVPAAMLSILALRNRTNDAGDVFWYPSGYLLTAAMLYAAAMFMIIHASFMGQEGGLQGSLATMARDFFEQQQAGRMGLPAGDAPGEMTGEKTLPMPEGLSPEQQQQMWGAASQFVAQYLPSVFMLSWLVFIVVTGVATLRALVPHKWTRRENIQLSDMQLPAWFTILTLALTVLSWITSGQTNFLITNLAILAGTGYMFVGLAMAHNWARGRKWGWAVLVPMYVLTIFGWPAMIIAAVGFGASVWRARYLLPSLDRRKP